MRLFLFAAVVLWVAAAPDFSHAAEKQKGLCVKVNGEKVEVHNLAAKPVVIDRDGIPDFAATSMIESVSTAQGSKSFNILLTGVKRDAKKTITSFDIKIDEKAYSYPKDSCGK